MIKIYELFRNNFLCFVNSVYNLDNLEEKYYTTSSTQTLISKQPTADGFELIYFE